MLDDDDRYIWAYEQERMQDGKNAEISESPRMSLSRRVKMLRMQYQADRLVWFLSQFCLHSAANQV